MRTVSNKKITIILFIFLAPLSFFSNVALAVWDGNPYAPGATNNPECLPSQTNCDVYPSVITTGATVGATLQSQVFTTGITSPGTITFSGFTSNGGPLYTNGSGVLVQTTAGTATQILHGGTTPSFSAVSLASDISGRLPFANLAQIAGLSVLGVTGTSTADVAAITGTADQVLRVNTAGTSLGFGTIANAGLTNSSISFTTGTTGTAPNWSTSPVSLGGTATLNIPDASASNRGLITTGTQTIAGDKTFTGTGTFSNFSGSSSGTNTGDVTLAGENYLSIVGQVITANAVNLSNTNVTGTLAAARFGALTGDVTNSAGSYATTIANDAVTYAKMQNVTTNRLLGRATSGSGDTEEITLGTGLSYTGTTLNVSGSALGSITVSTGTSGTDFNVSGSPVSLGGTVTLNIPDASGSNRGLVTTGTQTFAGAKTFSTSISNGGNYSQTAGTMSLTSANTTQVTTASVFALNANSLTIGTGMYLASSTLSSGSLIDLAITGTAGLTNQKGINVSLSGANGTGAQTTYGVYSSNTHSGTSNNVGLYATATGGTNNYAAIFAAGNVGVGTITPTRKLDVVSADNTSTTDIATFYSNNLTQGVSIRYGAIFQSGGVFDVGTGTSVNFTRYSASGTNRIDFLTAGNYRAAIDGGGMVVGNGYANGGATAPTNGLAVQGETWIGSSTDLGAFALQVTGDTDFVGNISQTSANVSGVTTASSFALNGNSLTSGTGLYIASSTLSSGKVVDVQVNSTATSSTGQTGINVLLTGANGTASQTTYALRVSNTHTGTTPANWSLYTDSGNAGIGAPTSTDANAALIVRQPNDGSDDRGIKILANNETTSLRLGYDKISQSGTLKLEGLGGTQILGSASAVKMNMTSGGLFFFGGSTTPTAIVHLLAGTTAASSAPLKFTSGTNMTTAEAGAVEWDGTNLFITQTTGPTRKTVAFLEGPTFTGTTTIGDISVSDATPTLSNAGFATCTSLTTVSNVITCTVSDRSVKDNFQPFTNGLDFIRNIIPQTYTFREGTPYFDNNRERLGLIAQEVQAAGLGDAVLPIGNGLSQIDFNAVTAATISAIKDLDLQITGIENFDQPDNSFGAKLRAWLANAENRITRIFTGEVCLTSPGEDAVCLNRAELQSLKTLINQPTSTPEPTPIPDPIPTPESIPTPDPTATP